MRRLHSLVTALALATATLTGCMSGSDDSTASIDGESSLPGSIDLWQSTDGWHFHVVAGNKRILLASEAYASRTAALNGVLSTLNNGVDPASYQVAPAAHGYLLHLVAANNEIIGFTETYSTKSSATRAIGACVRAVTSYLDQVQANQTGARVQVEVGAGGTFHWNLFAKNGEVVLASESYTTEAAAWNGAFAVQDAAQIATNFTVKTSTDGRFYFTLTAENGQVVGVSQMYTTRESAQTGIAAVQTLLRGMDLI
ncbi:MAG: YegP family protein [Deltaproteobacteria bacterium]|nr:YegP family protein [Deltaproteobacteria bacterium]